MRNRKKDARLFNKPITKALRAILNSRANEHFRSTTVGELIALRLVGRALEGDIQALKEIADRTEGRVPQAPAAEPEDAEIQVNIVQVGGEKAYQQALREFEQANPGCLNNKTN